jgi:hypothetical protein
MEEAQQMKPETNSKNKTKKTEDKFEDISSASILFLKTNFGTHR